MVENYEIPSDLDVDLIGDCCFNCDCEILNKKIISKIYSLEEVKKLCIDACQVVPEIGYVAWDVCLGPTKPCLIEGNDFPGHDLYQLPAHRKNNIGLLPIFEKIMQED